jgi:RimJ/RimL family protein N-acetyltransferase
MMQNKLDIACLHTKRLMARPLSSEDFSLLLAMNQNSQMMATLGGIRDVEATRKNLQWNLAQWQEHGFGLWLWFDSASKNLIGRGGLRKITIEQRPEIEISYALLPEYWGQGYAAEIALACMDVSFRCLNLAKLICHTTVSNKASQRVMEKIGMQFGRYFIQHDEPHILYELNAQEYWQRLIHFKPLAETDLKLLVTWLNKAHVKAWWDERLTPEQIIENYRNRLNDKVTLSFIIYFANRPIGFIQYYHAKQVGNGWWPDAKEGTVGIDQYLGEEGYINKGYGTVIIKQFVRHLFTNALIKKIIVDVDPQNLRAIRCYEKVGFKRVGLIQTPDGLALLMELLYKKSF